jgi:hypothetical protein
VCKFDFICDVRSAQQNGNAVFMAITKQRPPGPGFSFCCDAFRDLNRSLILRICPATCFKNNAALDLAIA